MHIETWCFQILYLITYKEQLWKSYSDTSSQLRARTTQQQYGIWTLIRGARN